MKNYYTGEDFPQDGVLMKESLYETLCRLEEARLGLRKLTKTEGRKTLAWLKTRLTLDANLHDGILIRTKYDASKECGYGYRDESGSIVRVRYQKGIAGDGAARFDFVLTCNAVRLSDLNPSLAKAVKDRFAWWVSKCPGMVANGKYCCEKCNAMYQMTLYTCMPKIYRKQESKFLAELKRCREGARRWRRYPFFTTLLALEAIDTPAVKRELKYIARNISSTPLKKYTDDSRLSRVRRVLLTRLMQYR